MPIQYGTVIGESVDIRREYFVRTVKSDIVPSLDTKISKNYQSHVILLGVKNNTYHIIGDDDNNVRRRFRFSFVISSHNANKSTNKNQSDR